MIVETGGAFRGFSQSFLGRKKKKKLPLSRAILESCRPLLALWEIAARKAFQLTLSQEWVASQPCQYLLHSRK